MSEPIPTPELIDLAVCRKIFADVIDILGSIEGYITRAQHSATPKAVRRSDLLVARQAIALLRVQMSMLQQGLGLGAEIATAPVSHEGPAV